MILFFFLTVIIYCFYIEVLNKTHLPPAEIILNHLIIVLSVITSPMILGIVFILWIVYTLKTWSYIAAQLHTPDNLFLFYSSTSVGKAKQFQSWFVVQMMLSVPMIIYGCFALVVGIVFSHYLLPVIIIAFVIVVSLVSASVHTGRANRPIAELRASMLLHLTTRLKKPYFSLYFYEIAQRGKLAFLLTKALTFSLMTGGAYLLSDQKEPLTTGSLIALSVALTHAFLIYRSHRFETSYLTFTRNFPYSLTRIYSSWLMNYVLLTIPESAWLLVNFDFRTALPLIALNLSVAVFYRNLLYGISSSVKTYLYWVFFSFLLFFLLVLLRMVIPIIVLNTLLSIVIIYHRYYHPKDLLVKG